MVVTRNYATKNNIKLYEGLPLKKNKVAKNDNTQYIFRFFVLITFFTLILITSNISYKYLFESNDKSLYNFIITDLPEKTIIKLYNNIPARPYNYFLDMMNDYNIDYF
jgi:hypothetical protein